MTKMKRRAKQAASQKLKDGPEPAPKGRPRKNAKPRAKAAEKEDDAWYRDLLYQPPPLPEDLPVENQSSFKKSPEAKARYFSLRDDLSTKLLRVKKTQGSTKRMVVNANKLHPLYELVQLEFSPEEQSCSLKYELQTFLLEQGVREYENTTFEDFYSHLLTLIRSLPKLWAHGSPMHTKVCNYVYNVKESEKKIKERAAELGKEAPEFYLELPDAGKHQIGNHEALMNYKKVVQAQREKMGGDEYFREGGPDDQITIHVKAIREAEAKTEFEKKKSFGFYLHDIYMPEGRDPEKDSYFKQIDPGVNIHPIKSKRGPQGTSQQVVDLRYAPLFYEFFSSEISGFSSQQKFNFQNFILFISCYEKLHSSARICLNEKRLRLHFEETLYSLVKAVSLDEAHQAELASILAASPQKRISFSYLTLKFAVFQPPPEPVSEAEEPLGQIVTDQILQKLKQTDKGQRYNSRHIDNYYTLLNHGTDIQTMQKMQALQESKKKLLGKRGKRPSTNDVVPSDDDELMLETTHQMGQLNKKAKQMELGKRKQFKEAVKQLRILDKRYQDKLEQADKEKEDDATLMSKPSGEAAQPRAQEDVDEEENEENEEESSSDEESEDDSSECSSLSMEDQFNMYDSDDEFQIMDNFTNILNDKPNVSEAKREQHEKETARDLELLDEVKRERQAFRTNQMPALNDLFSGSNPSVVETKPSKVDNQKSEETPKLEQAEAEQEEEKKYTLRRKPALTQKLEDLQHSGMFHSKKYGKIGWKLKKSFRRGLVSQAMMFGKSKQELRDNCKKLLEIIREKKNSSEALLSHKDSFMSFIKFVLSKQEPYEQFQASIIKQIKEFQIERAKELISLPDEPGFTQSVPINTEVEEAIYNWAHSLHNLSKFLNLAQKVAFFNIFHLCKAYIARPSDAEQPAAINLEAFDLALKEHRRKCLGEEASKATIETILGQYSIVYEELFKDRSSEQSIILNRLIRVQKAAALAGDPINERNFGPAFLGHATKENLEEFTKGIDLMIEKYKETRARLNVIARKREMNNESKNKKLHRSQGDQEEQSGDDSYGEEEDEASDDESALGLKDVSCEEPATLTDRFVERSTIVKTWPPSAQKVFIQLIKRYKTHQQGNRKISLEMKTKTGIEITAAEVKQEKQQYQKLERKDKKEKESAQIKVAQQELKDVSWIVERS